MSYRLCGRKEAQNSRSDPYADGIRKKSSVHKCQNLVILDRTLLSIRQGPARAFDFPPHSRDVIIWNRDENENDVLANYVT